MKQINVKEFMNSEMRNFSLADCERSLPNIMDGLNDSQRKAIFGLETLCKGGQLKVSQLAEMTSERTQYKHAGESLMGAIQKMAQDFPGSNNVPFFAKDGQFGNRASASPSAPRYVYVEQAPSLALYFKPDHKLIYQWNTNDGKQLEPVEYHAVIPSWIVNGASGIGTGYSCEIAPRKASNIRNYIEGYIQNKTRQPKTIDMLLMPHYNNYIGEIVQKQPTRFEAYGVFERTNRTTLTITELPINVNLAKYRAVLNALIDDKTIKDYSYVTTDNNITVTVEHPRALSDKSDAELIKIFKLVSKVSDVVNLIAVNDDGYKRVVPYENVLQALNAFIDKRVILYEQYRLAKIDDIAKRVEAIEARISFIEYWNTTKDVHLKSKEEVCQALNNITGIADYIDNFMQMTISSLHIRNIERLNRELADQRELLTKMENSSNIDLYMEDLKGIK